MAKYCKTSAESSKLRKNETKIAKFSKGRPITRNSLKLEQNRQIYLLFYI